MKKIKFIVKSKNIPNKEENNVVITTNITTDITTHVKETIIPTEILYMNSLTPKEKKAHDIAQNHLQSTFNLKKSVGYIEFCKKQSLNLENNI